MAEIKQCEDDAVSNPFINVCLVHQSHENFTHQMLDY
jgi:hypothetical protein